MCIGIILKTVVPVLGVWFFRSQLLKPNLKIVMKPALIIIYEYAGSDVHGVDQRQPLGNTALSQALLYFPGNVNQLTPVACFKP